MSASFPSAIPSFTTKVDQVDVNYAAHINRLQDEVRAISEELGVLPKGSFDSVRARLEALQLGKSGTDHTHDSRYWQRSLITGKGQLLVGLSSNNLEALSAGPTNRVLTTDDGTATGLKWSALTHSMFGDLTGDHYTQYARADGSRGAFLPLAGGTMSGRVLFDGHAEKFEDAGDISGLTEFDIQVADIYRATLVGNVEFSFTGATSDQVNSLTFLLIQDETGGREYIWPSSVRWVGSGPPAPGSAGEIALVSFVTFDGGDLWVGISLTEF